MHLYRKGDLFLLGTFLFVLSNFHLMIMMMLKKTATAQNLVGYIVTSSKDSHLPPRILRPRYISTPHVNYQYYKQYLEENSLVILSP